MISGGLAVGLGKIGDATVLDNTDAGYLFDPAGVSPTDCGGFGLRLAGCFPVEST